MKKIILSLTLLIIIGSTLNINIYSQEKYNEILKQDLELIEYLDKNAEKLIKKDKDFAQNHYKRKEGNVNQGFSTSTLLSGANMGTYLLLLFPGQKGLGSKALLTLSSYWCR